MGDIIHVTPIRTIKVTSSHKYCVKDDAKEYFLAFGEIKSVEMHPEVGERCLFVEFKKQEGASAALSIDVHCISENEVEVEPAEPQFQPDHILNALYDDCLQHIFGYLDLEDLTSVADVCTRFKQCANDVFPRKFEEIKLWGSYSSKSPSIESILGNFHSMIKKLTILSHKSKMNLFTEHSFSKLESLTLLGFEEFPGYALRNNVVKKPNLKKLELDCCQFHDLIGFLNLFPNLEVLILRCNRCKVVRGESFIYHKIDGTAFTSLFRALETNNVPIKKLCIENAEFHEEDFVSLLKLKQLKSIILTEVGVLPNDCLMKMAALPHLQELKLDFTVGMYFTDVKTMIRQASNLTHLELTFKFPSYHSIMRLNDYYEILEMVKNRSDKKQLSIILNRGYIVAVPKEILSSNRNFLRINDHSE